VRIGRAELRGKPFEFETGTMKLYAILPMMVLAGCSSVSSPKLTVTSAAPMGRSDEGVALAFMVDAENPNESALPLRTIEYTVMLDGRPVFAGTRSPEATLRRLGTQQIVLPAVVRLADHPWLAAGLASAGKVPFRIEGRLTYVAPGQIAEILFDSGVSVPTSTFSGAGEIDFGT